MVDKGANVNTDGQFFAQTEGALLKGYTPLTIAALKDHLELVKYLLAAGAKSDKGVEGKFFNVKTNCLTGVTDKTAIYYAIENGNLEMVKAMVESGANWATRVTIKQVKERGTGFNMLGQQVYVTTCFDSDIYTPSMYAKAAKQAEINAYLKSKGL
jgi:ankyrin repeat protein